MGGCNALRPVSPHRGLTDSQMRASHPAGSQGEGGRERGRGGLPARDKGREERNKGREKIPSPYNL